MKYPIGIQNFAKVRQDNYVYVDKTALIYQLADRGSYYFLSRPRRFGKSLLVSTMAAYFSGQKELFHGLALEQLEKNWIVYPVIYLDLNTGKYDSEDALFHVLNDFLCKLEDIYGKYPSEVTPELRFKGLIERIAKKHNQRVVILVDEYDKPMLQAIDNPELQDHFRNTLKAFYSVLKTQDQYIKFAFLTGVTKFGKVSVFSDLNNLVDISMDARYQGICGITQDELMTYFTSSVQDITVSLLSPKSFSTHVSLGSTVLYSVTTYAYFVCLSSISTRYISSPAFILSRSLNISAYTVLL